MLIATPRVAPRCVSNVEKDYLTNVQLKQVRGHTEAARGLLHAPSAMHLSYDTESSQVGGPKQPAYLVTHSSYTSA